LLEGIKQSLKRDYVSSRVCPLGLCSVTVGGHELAQLTPPLRTDHTEGSLINSEEACAWLSQFVPTYRNRAQAKGADTGTNIVALQRLLNSLQQSVSHEKSKQEDPSVS